MIIAFVLTCYLIGFMLAFGMLIGISLVDSDIDFGTIVAAFLIGLFSWITVGFIVGHRMAEDNPSTQKIPKNANEKGI